jgi:hypothetical protein
MKKALWLASFAMLAAQLSGCWVDIYDWGPSSSGSTYDDTGYYYGDPTVSNLVVTDGYLAGDMGAIEDFTAPAYEQTGQAYEGFASVEVHGGSGYWVMTRFDVEGGLDHPDLAPGAHLEFDESTRYSGESTLFISTTGCSGPSHGDWDFDAPAGHVEVDVEAGANPNDRIMYVTSYYDGYDSSGNPTVQVVESSFGYTVQ